MRVNRYLVNEFSILDQPRMPWEDVRSLTLKVAVVIRGGVLMMTLFGHVVAYDTDRSRGP
jgi:hypothetical protein